MMSIRDWLKQPLERFVRQKIESMSRADLIRLTNELNQLLRRHKINKELSPEQVEAVIQLIVDWVIKRL